MLAELPEETLSFEQLRDQLVDAGGAAVDLTIGEIAGDLGRAIIEMLGLARLRLQQFDILEASHQHIRIAGTVQVPVPHNPSRKVALGIDAQFSADAGGIGYALCLAVSPKAIEVLLGDLGKLLKALAVPLDSLWLTLSSTRLGRIQILTPGQEIADAVIDEGRGYLFRLGGKLLKSLKLDQSVFYLSDFPNSVSFDTRTEIPISIGRLIQLTITRIAVNGADAISFSGRGQFDFFGLKLAFAADLALSTGGIAFQFPIDDFVSTFDIALFRPLRFRNSVASFDGTLSSYAVGLAGDFRIAGSGNGGRYLVKYSSTSTAVVPDLFELESDRLTLSDVLTIASGVTIALPDFLNRVVVLEQSYIYYANRPGLLTLSGVPSVAGIRAHTNLSLLGYKAYAEVSALENGKSGAKLMLAPIRLGGIIEISGSGAGTPPGFSGNRIGKSAILLALDTDSKSASASLEVRLFGQPTIGAVGTLSENTVDFVVKAKLPPPLGETSFAAALQHETVSLRASVQMSVDVEAEWGFGRFRVSKAAQVEAGVEIIARHNGSTGIANVRASLGPVRVSFSLAFDPLNIDDLAELIRKRVVAELLAVLQQAGMWLQAVLDGTIRFLGDAADLAEAIGTELRDTFRATAREAAIILKKAGYELNNAYLVLERAYRVGLDEITDVMSDVAAWSEREIINWFRSICDPDELRFSAATIGDLLLRNGISTARVIEEVQSILKDVKLTAEVIAQLDRPAYEVARFLRNAGVEVGQAAEIVARAFFQLGKEALAEALSAGKYAAKEAGQAAENVFREAGRVIGDIRDELSRAWRRYKPRVTVRWRW